MMIIDIDRSTVPELTTEQMIEVDRAMIEDYGITPVSYTHLTLPTIYSV